LEDSRYLGQLYCHYADRPIDKPHGTHAPSCKGNSSLVCISSRNVSGCDCASNRDVAGRVIKD